MPYLCIKTNQTLAPEPRRELLQEASRTVAQLLGKPERYVMVSIDDGREMLFAGSDAPLAYLELKSIVITSYSIHYTKLYDRGNHR